MLVTLGAISLPAARRFLKQELVWSWQATDGSILISLPSPSNIEPMTIWSACERAGRYAIVAPEEKKWPAANEEVICVRVVVPKTRAPTSYELGKEWMAGAGEETSVHQF